MPPELSRPLLLANVPAAGRQLLLEATAEECAALTARFGIEAVLTVRASLALMPQDDGVVLAHGALAAEVVQLCVVSLEPVTQQLEAPLHLRLLPAGMAAGDGPDDLMDDIESEAGTVDIGEVVAEELALALDPYPRHPDAVLPPEATDDQDNLFAALARLKKPN